MKNGFASVIKEINDLIEETVNGDVIELIFYLGGDCKVKIMYIYLILYFMYSFLLVISGLNAEECTCYINRMKWKSLRCC